MLNKEIKQSYEDASKILQENKGELIKHLLSETSSGFMEKNAILLDDYFQDSFEKSMVGPLMGITKNPYAIIALGGYGRQEQCVHSDVDILFLFKKDVPEKAEALIREIIFPLWDIGLDIGHATRSLKDCTRLAGKDFEVLMSLLDARFICGMSPLYCEMVNQVKEKIIFRRSHKIVEWLREKNQERHNYYGDSEYLLEPNLKDGQGGLRDYHTMLWLGRIKNNLKNSRDLEYQGYLSHQEFVSLTHSLDFIWNVRNGLHILKGRKYDQLHFEHQLKLAHMFGYEDNNSSAVEYFLGDLHARMGMIKHAYQMFFFEMGKTKKWFKIKKNISKKIRIPGLEIKNNMLSFNSPEQIITNPSILMNIFEESAWMKIPINPESRRLIQEFDYLIDAGFRANEEIVNGFERILMLKSEDLFYILGDMVSTGFITRFIPEFKKIINKIEYDTYHVFPIDKHLLFTVRNLSDFAAQKDKTPDNLCYEIYTELSRKNLLLWAGLLHDIGKGEPGEDHADSGAIIAQKVMKRIGCDPEDIDLVSFLVKHHLFFYKIATRRNIEDEETVIFCARTIGDINRLKMLYLLTIADLVATGPKAWNDWTAALLRDLFLKTLKVLEKGKLETKDLPFIIQEKVSKLIDGEDSPRDKTEIETILNLMSQRYISHTSLSDIREHINLYRDLGKKDFVWKIIKNEDSKTRMVSICGRDTPGYFSKIAGVFALNRINILDARTYTWRNNIALSIFKVTPPPDLVFEDERWKRAEKELKAALSGKLNISKDMNERIIDDTPLIPGIHAVPHKINVDNTLSAFFTIIEVFTCDSPGLLFRLTDALLECRLDIWSAQIGTGVDQVVDVFYVLDFDGRKIESPMQAEHIKNVISSVLPKKKAVDYAGVNEMLAVI